MKTGMLGGSLVLAVLAAAGCQMGPVAMRANRTLYNEAMQDTSNQQLLLNIVRLKYREPMSFLEINAINTSYKFDVNGTLTAVNPRKDQFPKYDTSGGSRSASITGVYAEDPTFSYVPVQGDQFARRIIGDIDVTSLANLVRGGWHVDLFMRIAVDRIGNLVNDPTAFDEPNRLASHERFLQLSRLWRKLQERGDLAISVRSEEEVVAEVVAASLVTPALIMNAEKDGFRLIQHADGNYEMRRAGPPAVFLEARYQDDKEAQEADDLLGVRIPLHRDAQGHPIAKMSLQKASGLWPTASTRNELPVQVRSFVNVLFYVAKGVEVPGAHERDRVVKVYHDANGGGLDTRHNFTDLLDIRCSPVPPPRAMVSVFYRGCWFYIDDADLNSKDTFALLGYLYAVQAGDVKSNAPVLTLPVSK